ncbi:MAG TPA: hypothetical protein VGC08_01110 [Pedobacter sp.]
MTTLTNTRYVEIAKALQVVYPSVFSEVMNMCIPMLEDVKLIPRIYAAIRQNYPDIDRTDESILFTACVYKAYAPATFIGKGVARVRAGVREAMCEVMEWPDKPIVNYYAEISKAYIKTPTVSQRVSSVHIAFEKFRKIN